MKSPSFSILLLAASLLAASSSGDIQMPNVRIDHALSEALDPRLVVAGTISSIDPTYPDARFSFLVDSVVLGSPQYRSQTLVVPVSFFAWPAELLPFRPESRCALVLAKSVGAEPEFFYPLSVVPLANTSLPAAAHAEEAIAALAREIVAQLPHENDPQRQRALLLQLAPILPPNLAESVAPFLESPDPSVASSALAALVYSTENPEYLRKAALDVRQFFSQAPAAPGASPNLRLLFNTYFFLDPRGWKWGSRWSEEEARKHLRILDALFSTGILPADVQHLLRPPASNP